MSGIDLNSVVKLLETVAPLEYAEDWDNVGLLVAQPRKHTISQIMLTIDLDERVLAEATDLGIHLIVAYHPPIFAPLKRLTSCRVKERIILDALSANIAIYSPHTALDAAPGGVNDWLADLFGPGERQPIRPYTMLPSGEQFKVVTFVPETHVDRIREAMANAGAGRIGEYEQCSFNIKGEGTFFGGKGANPTVGQSGRLERVPEVRLEMVCGRKQLPTVADALHQTHPYEEPAWEVYTLTDRPNNVIGQGRFVTMDQPRPLVEVVERIKQHLNLKHVRLARSHQHRDENATIQTVALCAGAGGSVLNGVDADLLLTGEMRHHDVLDAVASGTNVVLCDHTNTERGYLPRLADRIMNEIGDFVSVTISSEDADPLVIV